MNVLIKLSKEEEELLREYGKFYVVSLSTSIENSVFEKSEYGYDEDCIKEVYEEYKKDPVKYSFKDIDK